MTDPGRKIPNWLRLDGGALVAGGSGAIGREICLGLARAGANVAFTYHHNQEAASRLAQEIEACGVRCLHEAVALEDALYTQAFVDRVAAQLAPLQHVVYAAGPPLHMKRIHELTAEEWSRVIDVDVKGSFNFLSASLPHLKHGGGGSIVAVITAAVERVPSHDIMSASPKAAVEMLVRGIAKEEGRNGIRANCVGPGWIEGGLGKQMIEHEISSDIVERIRRSLPLRRFGQPREIAEAVLFLLSNHAGFITGQSLAVDGGGQL